MVFDSYMAARNVNGSSYSLVKSISFKPFMVFVSILVDKRNQIVSMLSSSVVVGSVKF